MIKNSVFTAALLCGFCGCVAPLAPLAPRVLRAGAENTAPVVVVLETKESALNDAVLERFTAGVDAHVVAYTEMAAIAPDRLAAAIRLQKPMLILALGPQAALFARDTLPEISTLFALVLNYRTQNLQAGTHISGIAMENSLVSEFTQFKLLYPGLRRIFMPYTKGHSDIMVQEARGTLATLNVAIKPLALSETGQVPNFDALEHHEGDVLWLASDALVLRNAKALIQRSNKLHIPVVASVSGVLAHAGAMIAIEVDIPSIGAQAADMASLLLSGRATPHDMGVQPPIGTQLVVNLAVAQRNDIDIPLQVMSFVGEVVNELPVDGP